MFFLGIHGGHKEISVGIFAAQMDCLLVESESIPNAQASKQLVFAIDRLLEKQNLYLQNLAFIFVNQGPAPFTTLRTVLATVNALSFARNIPLVGIDSLKALVAEDSGMCDKRNENPNIKTVALLDAFNNDVYYCFKAETPEGLPESGAENSQEYETGYENIAAVIIRLKKVLEFESQKYNRSVRLCLVGNGTQLHKLALEAELGSQAVWPENMPLAASLDFMAQCALEDFNGGHVVTKLSPLYLKLHPAEIAKQKT